MSAIFLSAMLQHLSINERGVWQRHTAAALAESLRPGLQAATVSTYSDGHQLCAY